MYHTIRLLVGFLPLFNEPRAISVCCCGPAVVLYTFFTRDKYRKKNNIQFKYFSAGFLCSAIRFCAMLRFSIRYAPAAAIMISRRREHFVYRRCIIFTRYLQRRNIVVYIFFLFPILGTKRSEKIIGFTLMCVYFLVIFVLLSVYHYFSTRNPARIEKRQASFFFRGISNLVGATKWSFVDFTQ